MKTLTPLSIETGVDDYHVNQFRIYFRPIQNGSVANISSLVSDLTENFPKYFNGKEQEGLAAVTQRNDVLFQGKPSLQFVGNLKIQPFNIDLPDAHSDWVGHIWQDSNVGFAVQTMARLFWEKGDDTLKTAVETSLIMTRPILLLEPINRTTGKGILTCDLIDAIIGINRQHFLAGRRSWIIKRVSMQEASDASSPAGHNKSAKLSTGQLHKFVLRPLYYLETAAIERYSSLAFEAMELDPGIIVDIRSTISGIWIRFLKNYLAMTKYESTAPERYDPIDDGGDLWRTNAFCRYRETRFKTADKGMKKQWVKQLITDHPALYAKEVSNIQKLSLSSTNNGKRSSASQAH